MPRQTDRFFLLCLLAGGAGAHAMQCDRSRARGEVPTVAAFAFFAAGRRPPSSFGIPPVLTAAASA
ncbi:hypothetical protein [Protofrankia symbiont of Coriaria ruscifolia]|uniref:Uncharacterized protein n=1 Tax=Candidatus Protofrankia californiensis TaxID=1839754 RepID=A0A1C3P7T2_9ACTN|nr:hypothetical protein [Protofrankia symbiont of Coriaria ruscifolia]SBW25861.1 hypothetical protein FDG2_4706 [Candidatus Protofrankia californiensis]